MFNGTMDPELIRIAQEQMSRMSPADLTRIQQQMMSNPELMRMASESMKNIRAEDLRNAADQLKYTRPEEMADIAEKMANSSPEEIATMRAHVDAQATYELNAAEMLKKQGNELHNQGNYHDALQKYLLAKKNLKGVLSSKGKSLLLVCSLNMMSCYLKTRQYDECIKEGTEVLAHDVKNLKALYRRGQAYKESGLLEDAVSDLSKAHEISPDDETIADVLRDAKETLMRKGGGNASRGILLFLSKTFSINLKFRCLENIHLFSHVFSLICFCSCLIGLVIEEITEEDVIQSSEICKTSSKECSVPQVQNTSDFSERQPDVKTNDRLTNSEAIQALKDDPDAIRSFQNFVSRADPETLAAISGGRADAVSPDMIKTASNMINTMSPEELQRMLQLASSFQGENSFLKTGSSDSDFNSFRGGRIPPDVTPDMLKMASDMMSKMPAEGLQKMFEKASSLKGKDSMSTVTGNGSRSDSGSRPAEAHESFTARRDVGQSSSSNAFQSSRGTPQSSFPNSTSELQEQMKNQLNDPAMRQMFSSMIKNMNPEMMANMSEQFGVKLSREDAEKAQQAMSSLSPDDLDRMMRWVDRIQRGVECARKAKNWLLGKPGMIFAILMLILAIILHRLGYIGS